MKSLDPFNKRGNPVFSQQLHVSEQTENSTAFSSAKYQVQCFWTMGGYLVVLVGVALLLTSGQCDVSCRGINGQDGEAGAPGRDGYPGVKGEKGESAVRDGGLVDAYALRKLKGEAGNQGPQGDMGPKGFRGHVGDMGQPGAIGSPGPDGKSIGHGSSIREEQLSPHQGHSAFSVIRTVNTYPSIGQAVTFQSTVVNRDGDFNTATGRFTCRVPGVYYFTFHSMAKVSMCLSIASTVLNNKLGFCDYNRNTDQVLSGGVVLQLTATQTVWLESFRDQQRDAEMRDSQDKRIIFSGFLLFPNPE